jgi:hypothetical protein
MAAGDPIRLSEPPPEDLPLSQDKLKVLRQRCETAGLPFVPIPPDPNGWNEEMYTIEFPCGREKKRFYFHTEESLDKVLGFQFEKFSFLTEVEAIVSREDKMIEAPIRPIGQITHAIVERLLHVENPPFIQEMEFGAVLATASKTVGSNQFTATFQKVSAECAALLPMPMRQSGAVSLVIRGVEVPTHDDALRVLRKISTALFIQLDVTHGLPLRLIPTRSHLARQRRRAWPAAPKNITFPDHEYDEAPASLYFYGRGARGMPLLQFLAFYQTIEFYFPTYSQAAARRRIRLILKDPSFRADQDAQLTRILTTVDPSSRFGLGDEKAQLTATINECVDPRELREFIEDSEDMKDFLKSKHKALTDVRLPLDNQDSDLRQPLAERIYDIRCRIVHTKGSRVDVDLLLPSSREAAMLGHDIELVQFVALKTLMATSAALNLV